VGQWVILCLHPACTRSDYVCDLAMPGEGATFDFGMCTRCVPSFQGVGEKVDVL
jgi:hypothetical protein